MHPLWLKFLILFSIATERLVGLKCKQGMESQLTGEKSMELGQECQRDAKHCVTALCENDKTPNSAAISWFCDVEQNAEKCAERLKKSSGGALSCKCQYGAEGVDNGNENSALSLPNVQQGEKVLMCKTGMIDGDRISIIPIIKGICTVEDHHCFAANCSNKDDGQLQAVFWGCAKSNEAAICTDIEQAIKSHLNSTAPLFCECLFGRRGRNFANEAMMLHHLFWSSVAKSTNANLVVATSPTTTGTGNEDAKKKAKREADTREQKTHTDQEIEENAGVGKAIAK